MVFTESGYSDENGKSIRESNNAIEEGKAAARILGASLYENHKRFPVFGLANTDDLRRDILRAIKELEVDTMLCHWEGDVHSDHLELGKAAMMSARHLPRLLMYRSNYYDSGKTFNPGLYVDISDTFNLKIEAIKEYRTEFSRSGTIWVEYLEGLNRMDGMKVGVKYAESFEAVRFLL
jgi:LmbE family N-acetylglucosaminyl deacetylase